MRSQILMRSTTYGQSIFWMMAWLMVKHSTHLTPLMTTKAKDWTGY